jgi:hypothetical protein
MGMLVDLVVLPRSSSLPLESLYRVSPAVFEVMIPDMQNMASVSVDFPWYTEDWSEPTEGSRMRKQTVTNDAQVTNVRGLVHEFTNLV